MASKTGWPVISQGTDLWGTLPHKCLRLAQSCFVCGTPHISLTGAGFLGDQVHPSPRIPEVLQQRPLWLGITSPSTETGMRGKQHVKIHGYLYKLLSLQQRLYLEGIELGPRGPFCNLEVHFSISWTITLIQQSNTASSERLSRFCSQEVLKPTEGVSGRTCLFPEKAHCKNKTPR